MNKKLLIFFLMLICGCSIFYYAIIKYDGFNNGSNLVAGLMWIPAFSAFTSKLICDHSIKGIGWRFPKLKFLLISYFLPLVGCLIVYGLVWITGLGQAGEISSFLHLVIFAIVGVFVSAITAIGEEIGWRGFLLTELRRKFTYPKICLIIGLVWFVYHVPLILFSTYNNGNIITSVICFFFMVMGMSSIACYLCIKTNSMWPGVILHASHNLFVQSIFDEITINGPYTQYVTSEFGVGLAVVYCIIAIFLLLKYKKNCNSIMTGNV